MHDPGERDKDKRICDEFQQMAYDIEILVADSEDEVDLAERKKCHRDEDKHRIALPILEIIAEIIVAEEEKKNRREKKEKEESIEAEQHRDYGNHQKEIIKLLISGLYHHAQKCRQAKHVENDIEIKPYGLESSDCGNEQ